MKIRINKSKILSKTNRHCAYCGAALSRKTATIDHIIPKAGFIEAIRGKAIVPKFLAHLTIHDVNHFDNLLPCCSDCNHRKKNLSIEQFRELEQVGEFFFETISNGNLLHTKGFRYYSRTV